MPLRRFINLVILLFAALLLALAAASLKWAHLHDAPVMLYCGMLIERFGLTPYRDFFDMNLPGAHLFFAALGRLFGYSDAAFRLVDLALLSSLLALTWGWMRRFDRRAAWAGAALFGLAYLGGGETISMQRDYLVLIPIAATLWALTAEGPRPGLPTRALLTGLGFGMAATVKPHAAIGLAPALAYLCLRDRNDAPLRDEGLADTAPRHASRWGLVSLALLGAALPVAAMLGWLAWRGALGAFFDLATHYWPLYGGLSGGHFPVHGLDRLTYLGEEFQKLGGLGPWLAPAVLALTLFLTHPALAPGRRREAGLLAGLAAAYAVYPALTGQFWAYHWLPCQYFLIQAGALCLSRPVESLPGLARRVVPLFFVAVAVPLVWMMPAMQPWSTFKWAPADNPLKAALIGQYLKERLHPGDTVQTLDWCAGGVHGALLAGARPATRFIYDFHFYHDVSSPYIQGLRRELLRELSQSRPRFIVQTVGDRPVVRGKDTSERFEALEGLIQANYHVATRGPGFVIYERNGP